MPITSKVALPLCRPREPSFIPKLNYRFDIPAENLCARYKDIGVEILEQYNDETIEMIPLKVIKYPDLKYLKTFNKRAEFSVFNPQHMEYATALMKIFDEAKDVDELVSLAVYCRDHLNSELFVYSYYTVLAHRNDTQNIELPQIYEINPQHYFDKHTITELRAAAHEKRNLDEVHKNVPIVIDFSFRGRMSVHNTEEKLKFFTEDLGVNSHHYHWHAIYPNQGPTPKYYAKDRRGELFYFMHHQIINWYDCNRLSAGIPQVQPFDNFREPMKVGYFSELILNRNSIPPRQDNEKLRDVSRVEAKIKVNNLERWYNRISEAIDNGFAIDNHGKKVNLINDKGIDNLTNTIEPHVFSINSDYYGALHSSGHQMIGYIHDPTNKYKTGPGIMLGLAYSMRDVAFYQWHKMFDDLCLRLTAKLPPYRQEDLKFNDIKITSIDLLDKSNDSVEQLITFWQQSKVDLQYGLDFHSDIPTLITFIHLNYQNFTYSLKVENRNCAAIEGTVRIFLLPVKDEANESFLFDGCRKLAIQLDQFLCKFSPGMNHVKRKSSESSVTIPFDRTFPSPQDGTTLMSNQLDDSQTYCMCGWPQHLLLPKGTEDGYPFRIFVIITDYKIDKVDQNPSNGVCNDNYVLCGLRNRKYPDKRAMGFPFDRPATDNISEFDDFLIGMDNMISKQITIRHLDENMAQIGDDPANIVKLS